MWTPWSSVTGWADQWGRNSNAAAVENARVAAVACSRALLERVEIEQYVEEIAARRTRPSISA
jgi:hypothetical protein